MSIDSVYRRAVILGWLVLGGCAPATVETQPIALAPVSEVPAPAPWQRVRLETVTGHRTQALAAAVSPAEALSQALRARLGKGGKRDFVLRVENVRTAVSSDVPSFGAPAGVKLGLAADLVLQGPGGQRRLQLEQSLDALDPSDLTSGLAYSLLVDDLCDRALADPAALELLGGAGTHEAPDSALARSPRPEVGPVLALEPSTPGAQASGRVLWGHAEHSSNGFANLMLGDMKGVLAGVGSGSADTRSGLGMLYGAGIGGIRMDVGDGSSTTMFLAHLMLGFQAGLLRTVHDEQGYVERPGLSLMLAPQFTMDMTTGKFSVPDVQVNGTTITQGTQDVLVTTLMYNAGAAASVDLPLTSFLGIKAGYYLGVVSGQVTSSISGSMSIPATLVHYPTADVYLQTATGRMSLGLGFQALSGAADGGITSNPMVVFTFEDQVGRGVAYGKSSLSVAGLDVKSDTQVLSAPRSAFVAAGAPETAPAGRKGEYDASIAASSDPTVATQHAGESSLWAVLPVRADEGLGATTPDLARSILEQVARDAGDEVVPAAEVTAAATALGVTDWQRDALAELASAVGARHVLRAELRLLPSGEVEVDLVRFDAPDQTRSAKETGTRVSILRLVKEQAAALVGDAPL